MSQENVEIVRRGYRAWNRGDLDACSQPSSTPERHDCPRGSRRARSCTGRRGGMRASWQSWLETGRPYADRVDEFFDAGRPGRARALVGEGQGGAERIETELDLDVCTVRDGKVIRGSSLLDQRRSPRSRRAHGVGDVAGERGDRAAKFEAFNRIVSRGARLRSELLDPEVDPLATSALLERRYQDH